MRKFQLTRQYIRDYKLIIQPVTGSSREISQLKIDFEITKSVLSFPNLARIDIYNPNKDTEAALKEKFTNVILNVGYVGNLKLIFKGEVRNVFNSKIGTERIITVYAGDGQRDWQNTLFNKTFAENVPTNEVIRELLSSFKSLSLGTIEGLPTAADKLRGQTLSGSSKDILDTFAAEYGFTWSIQDGEVVTTPIERPIVGTEAVVINSATGMVGSPTITEIGVDVTTLLNPDLLPNRVFQVESVASDVSLGNIFFRNVKKTSAEGLYKIQEVTFKGTNRDGDWLSTVKGMSLNG